MSSVLDLLQGHSILDVLHHERGELISEMPPAEVILSVGCADGEYFRWFGDNYSHKIARHIGIDILPRPEDVPPEVEWHQGSFADLSVIPTDSIDLLFAGQAVEHVPTHECLTFLEHAHRVLRQDHWLIMDSPNFEITRVWPFPNPEHVIEYTPSQICSILKAAGFRVVRRKGILLAKEDGKLIDEPYEYERLDYRRLKDAKERPDESFIWWIEATKSGDFNRRRVARLLAEVNRSYERQRNRSTRKRPKAAQTGAAPTLSSAAAGNPTPSSGSIRRRVFRRVVPRRIRALMRGVYRLASGWYLRTVVQLLEDLKGQNVTQVAQIEAQSEILDLMLRRLRLMEEANLGLGKAIEQLDANDDALRSEFTTRLSEMNALFHLSAPLSLASTMAWNPSSEAHIDADELAISKAYSEFYLRFQDRHRGSEEVIRERQRGRLTSFASCRRVLDVGCGRGEFLALLAEQGIVAEGIDTNEKALEICRAKGLSVHKADALTYLSTVERGSFDGIHLSHLLEHVPFATAVDILRACTDELPAGGVVLAETPNPHCMEALQVFFLDPTHIRPLFPEALTILLESLGYERVTVHFLNAVRPSSENQIQRGPQDFADYLVSGVKSGVAEQPALTERSTGSRTSLTRFADRGRE